mmetsp:Transcript_36226/g.61099  ORF Transcript_36226/g.61099 Transcript_36226/m.61099 type:complete len:235 (+) Transcript_36226:285-989(+)
MAKRLRKLVLKLRSPNGCSTRAVSQRISSLQHEALDDAVDEQVVVVAVLAVAREVLNRLRALLGVQLEVDVSEGGVYGGPGGEVGGGQRRDVLRGDELLCVGLLVEDVAAHGGVHVVGLARGEEVEALLLEGAAEEGGVLLHRLAALPRGRPLALRVLGDTLIESDTQEPLRVLHLADQARQAVGDDVDHLDAQQCGVDDEVPALVEDGVLHRRFGVLSELALRGHAAPKVNCL